jgi:TolB-like protein
MPGARFAFVLLAAAIACSPSVRAPDLVPRDRTREELLAALAHDPQDFRAMVELGIVSEKLGQYGEALAAYRRAEAMHLPGPVRKAVEQRLTALTRLRLTAEVRAALAAEQSLAVAAPRPNTIAVLPWTYLGSRPELKPLERGLAHLVVSDLAKVSRFTLLERERVQLIADELALGSAGRMDPATAARSGRLLRAAEVIQGSIRETSAAAIRLEAQVVSTTTAELRASGSASDQLAQLFAMEKLLVLDLLERLGVTLTPAEQRAIAERPTADVQAFLAFSRGLEAEDRGDFAAATRQFGQAATRDPSFEAARQRAAANRRAGSSVSMTPSRLAQTLRIEPAHTRTLPAASGIRAVQLASALQGIAPTLAGRLMQHPGRLTAIRGRLAEALRQDDLGRLGTLGQLVVTIPRP